MSLKTPLNALHRAAGARMVDFGGWDMPLHYGSQLEEHHAVRQSGGLFDVSHMAVVDLQGDHCEAFLRRLLANDVAKLKRDGRALYSCMLNGDGCVIDDLITYRIEGPHRYRMVVNAATREKDLAWIRQHAADAGVEVLERTELAMLAAQGPIAREQVIGLLPEAHRAAAEALGRFACLDTGEVFLARTGYTGEDGFEVILPAAAAAGWWQQLVAAGLRPIGLGARDSLRLEAGLNLYGQDMDETTSPLESNLAWTVALDPHDRDFIGRSALAAALAQGVGRQLVGVVLTERGVLRHGQKVLTEAGVGEITSGGFSPTLGVSVGLARIPAHAAVGLQVDIRGKSLPLHLIQPPFVRAGKPAPGLAGLVDASG